MKLRVSLCLLLLPTVAFGASGKEATSALRLYQDLSREIARLGARNSCRRQEEGCSALVEKFCDTLFNSTNKGNIDLHAGNETLPVRLGKMPNHFNFAYAAFQQAKLDAQTDLPADLKSKLEKAKYFKKLKKFIEQKGKDHWTQSDILQINNEAVDIEQIWDTALAETGLERAEKAHPGYNQANPIPLPWARDHDEIASQLSAEVYRTFGQRIQHG